MHKHTRVETHSDAYVCMHTRADTHMYMCTSVHTHIHTHMDTHIRTQTHAQHMYLHVGRDAYMPKTTKKRPIFVIRRITPTCLKTNAICTEISDLKFAG